MRFPHFDWYPWDFDEDEKVRVLTWQEKGVYTLVLSAMWRWAAKHDSPDLPDNNRVIAGQIGMPIQDWIAVREVLVDNEWAPLQLDPNDHVVYSKRMREEYAKALKRGGGSSEAFVLTRIEFKSMRPLLIGALLDKYQNQCAICGRQDNLEVDHIVPVARGGTNDIDNLQILCRRCNASKGARLPNEQ